MKGFTLLELIVVIGFFVVMSVLISVSLSQFGSHITLTNLAYDIALTLRQAQVYGVSVSDRRLNSLGACDFQSGYGVMLYGGAANNKIFIMFADDPKDLSSCAGLSSDYNRRCGGASDNFTTPAQCEASTEFVKSFNIAKGNYISKFCAVLPGGDRECNDNGVGYLAISFLRPNPEPFIRTNRQCAGGCSFDVPPVRYQSALIEVSTSGGTKKNTVSISATGHISVLKGGI